MKFLVILLCLIPLHSMSLDRPGGYERGNGGIELVCTEQSPAGQGTYSLDHLEGQLTYDLETPPNIASMTDENQIVQYVLAKLSVVNPSRAELYQTWLAQLLSQRQFVENSAIEPLSETGDVVFIPTGCKKMQAAVFITNPDQSNIQFIFDKNLWQASSPVDRAYLLMHELIYREARLPENDQQNSMASRSLNAWLFAYANDLDEAGWVAQVRKTGFEQADYKGWPLRLTFENLGQHFVTTPMLYFADSLNIQKATIRASFSITINGELFSRECSEPLIDLIATNFVEFYPSGKIKQLVFEKDVDPTCGDFHGNNKLDFDEKGHLTAMSSVGYPYFFNFSM